MIPPLIWLPAALSAGGFQAWRTAIQQRLRGELTVSGAGLVRYVYGAPVGAALAVAWLALTGQGAPVLSPGFLLLAAAGGLAQVLGTNVLIMAFGYRNFVVGTAFPRPRRCRRPSSPGWPWGSGCPPSAGRR